MRRVACVRMSIDPLTHSPSLPSLPTSPTPHLPLSSPCPCPCPCPCLGRGRRGCGGTCTVVDAMGEDGRGWEEMGRTWAPSLRQPPWLSLCPAPPSPHPTPHPRLYPCGQPNEAERQMMEMERERDVREEENKVKQEWAFIHTLATLALSHPLHPPIHVPHPPSHPSTYPSTHPTRQTRQGWR